MEAHFLFLLVLPLAICQHQHGMQQQQQQQVYYQQQPQMVQMGIPQQGFVQQAGFQQPQMQLAHVPGAQPNLIRDKSHIQDREHIKEHLQGVVNIPDVSKMSEEELQFHYFKMHDNDDNNKLDGLELIKSLIHWHVEESKQMGNQAPAHGTTKIFTDNELVMMIDPIMDMDDRNKDGFIDYPEFVAAQQTRGF